MLKTTSSTISSGGEQAFSRAVIGREIPAEKNEQNQPDKES